jgi:hypothetical protein
MTRIRRLLVLLAAVVGVLAATEAAAHAGLSGINHCEPLRRR